MKNNFTFIKVIKPDLQNSLDLLQLKQIILEQYNIDISVYKLLNLLELYLKVNRIKYSRQSIGSKNYIINGVSLISKEKRVVNYRRLILVLMLFLAFFVFFVFFKKDVLNMAPLETKRKEIIITDKKANSKDIQANNSIFFEKRLNKIFQNNIKKYIFYAFSSYVIYQFYKNFKPKPNQKTTEEKKIFIQKNFLYDSKNNTPRR